LRPIRKFHKTSHETFHGSGAAVAKIYAKLKNPADGRKNQNAVRLPDGERTAFWLNTATVSRQDIALTLSRLSLYLLFPGYHAFFI
jgi:hypothetical protein